MQPVDKFRSELAEALRRSAAAGKAAPESLRRFLEGRFPGIRGEAAAALVADYLEKRRSDPEAAAAWLETVGTILFQDYDGSPLAPEDWASLREAFSAGAEEVDIELLTYVMSLVLEHGAL